MSAMKVLVRKNVSGMAVVDSNGHVLGVVSGYDILALESTPGKFNKDEGMFPPIDKCVKEYGGDKAAMWSAFKELQKRVLRSKGNSIGDIMREAAVAGQDDSVEKLSDMIVQQNTARVFIVDGSERLVGLVTRGDIMRSYLSCFKEYMEESFDGDVDDL